jgi:short-subunit dehydrogenase
MPTILITGASSGIGAACARVLACEHRLVLVARRADRLAALLAELPGSGHRSVAADLASDEGIAAAAAAVDGELHALVNNAGIFACAEGAAIDRAHLAGIWRLNVDAPLLLTAALLPRLAAGGAIVNISSVAAESAFAGCGAYSASKAALEAWSRCLREELRPRGVRVCVVAPGATATDIWPAGHPADRSRMAAAADVAAAVRLAIVAPPAASFDRIQVTPTAGPV